MIVDVTAKLGAVDFAPETELKEIIQNVRTICTTAKHSVPMDREFGIDGGVLDAPMGVAQARLTAEIARAVQKYEPRAKVKKILYDGSEDGGQLRVTIRIEVSERGT
jgi:GPW/gp25 family protein|nr:MAG TPA: baseplate wedge subunit [Caudoviricetes sp.]